MTRWSIRKVNGRWRVYDRGVWHETHATLPEAHTAATQYAVMDELCLTWLKALLWKAQQ